MTYVGYRGVLFYCTVNFIYGHHRGDAAYFVCVMVILLFALSITVKYCSNSNPIIIAASSYTVPQLMVNCHRSDKNPMSMVPGCESTGACASTFYIL